MLILNIICGTYCLAYIVGLVISIYKEYRYNINTEIFMPTRKIIVARATFYNRDTFEEVIKLLKDNRIEYSMEYWNNNGANANPYYFIIFYKT